MSQERQIIKNGGANLEFTDTYEYYNHLEPYKITDKTLKYSKNRYIRDGRRNHPTVQYQYNKDYE